MQSLIHAIDTLLRPWPLQLVINLSDSFSCHIIIYIPSQFMNSIGLLTLLCWISSAVLSRMQSEQGDASENCIVAATLILSGPSWTILSLDFSHCFKLMFSGVSIKLNASTCMCLVLSLNYCLASSYGIGLGQSF